MGQQDRRTAILEVLNRRNAASIRELAALVYASEASVRRDVAALEEEYRLRYAEYQLQRSQAEKEEREKAQQER